jgi:hypothetical protein
MSCKGKISTRCGKQTSSACVKYEGKLHLHTALDTEDCHSVEETLEDIADELDSLEERLDLSSLTSNTCIDYSPAVAGKPTPVEVLEMLQGKIITIMEKLGMSCDGCPSCVDCNPIFTEDISCMNLNFGELVDACGNQPTTLQELFQLLLDNLQP